MSIFLCGETGIVNRGCEAIIRSTVKVLNRRSGDIYIATSAPEMDMSLTKELGINMIGYNSFPTKYHRYYAAIMRRLKHSVDGKFLQAELFSRVAKKDICLNIGGDTYCYDRPSRSIELNNYTTKHGINNILWCCSIEEDVMHGEILKDLKEYRYIFAREGITYQNLLKAGITESNIVKCCDPAFFLDKEKVELPKGFVDGNTVGFNVSELIISEKYPNMYEYIVGLIKEILEKTDMSVCLIPHVYSIEKNLCDWPILSKIYGDIQSDRICIVDEEYNCEQLKYIISKCRFMIAARTHASIAAYSSEIPTLVLGYSVKSKGIAQDLFGTYEHYVLPNKEITPKRLSEDFWFIYQNEQAIRDKLRDYLPEYRQQLLNAISKLNELDYKSNEICDHALCTGCQACRLACPKDCITMKQAADGFYYPSIDEKKCISCGKCQAVCPVVNRYKDDCQKPLSFIAVNKDEDILRNSSSGGVFHEIAEKVLGESGVVFGAAFDEQQNVEIVACGSSEEIKKLYGSKYVQADVQDTYKDAEKKLKAGKKVLFSGTPCQIGGLYAYLGKEYDNLITVDIICHGVPSPKAWEEYKDSVEKKYGARIKKVNFRCKDTGWRKYSLSFLLEDGRRVKEKVTENLYLRAFITHLIVRPSCYMCSYKQIHRQADITLGDFWAINKCSDMIDDDKGTSVVFLHSKKGRILFDSIKTQFRCKEIDFSKAIIDNSSYLTSKEPSPYQRLFNKKWEHKSFPEAVKLFCEKGKIADYYRKLKLITNWSWK